MTGKNFVLNILRRFKKSEQTPCCLDQAMYTAHARHTKPLAHAAPRAGAQSSSRVSSLRGLPVAAFGGFLWRGAGFLLAPRLDLLEPASIRVAPRQQYAPGRKAEGARLTLAALLPRARLLRIVLHERLPLLENLAQRCTCSTHELRSDQGGWRARRKARTGELRPF